MVDYDNCVNVFDEVTVNPLEMVEFEEMFDYENSADIPGTFSLRHTGEEQFHGKSIEENQYCGIY